MGLEEKAEARERRGPVWTGAVQENMDGFEEGLPVSPRLEEELKRALLPH